jgi:hypothetical protein
VAAPVAALVKGLFHEMWLMKLKMAGAVVVGLCVAGLGVGAITYRAQVAKEPALVKARPAASVNAMKPDEGGKKDVKPEDPTKGRVEPAGAPLEVRLVANKTTYTLDRGGKTPEEYAESLETAKRKDGRVVVPAPQVDLILDSTTPVIRKSAS